MSWLLAGLKNEMDFAHSAIVVFNRDAPIPIPVLVIGPNTVLMNSHV